MSTRRYPQVMLTMLSPFKSSRGGQKVRLVVLHATASHNKKGLADLKAIGAWFQNPVAGVSAHVCVDNEGNSARYVKDGDKAWHCAGYNGVSIGIEQILPGDGSEITEHMYRETARWVAYYNKTCGVPIRRGRVLRGRVLRSGVVTHKQLGSTGGAHNDPGPRYSVRHVLRHAKHYRKEMDR